MSKINIPMGAPGGAPPPLSLRMFQKYDKDGSGKIDKLEFKGLVYDLGHSITPHELDMAVKSLADGSGQIPYESFKTWWAQADRFAKLKLSAEQEKILAQAVQYFKYFDKDLSQTIDKDEAVALHADLVKNKLTHLSCAQFMQDLDSNGDGVISFAEYVDWLVRKSILPVKVL
jgi:Ca2+-binding EF-hand superfamily protein